MPRYHFAVLNKSGRDDDHVETELANDAAARNTYLRVIRELWRGEGDNWKGWLMEVTQDERLVWQIPFEAIEPKEAPGGQSGNDRATLVNRDGRGASPSDL